VPWSVSEISSILIRTFVEVSSTTFLKGKKMKLIKIIKSWFLQEHFNHELMEEIEAFRKLNNYFNQQ